MTSLVPSPIPRWLRVLGWTGFVVWAITITVLSSLRPDQLEKIAPWKWWDKAEHFLAFAAGSANLALVLRWQTGWSAARVALVSIAAISFFGAVDEIHQLFTPGRSGADVFDWTADTLGAAAGVVAMLFTYARYSRTRLLAPARD